MDNYNDIINYPYSGSNRPERLSMEARAAQFAPFAALTGHGAAIDETARLTSPQIELSDDERLNLSRKINYALSHPESPVVTITYFKPDSRKAGGSYITVSASIRKIDEYFNLLILSNGTKIALDAVYSIEGSVFNNF